MATIAIKKVQREKEIWFHRCPERGHASRTRKEDNPRSRRYDEQEIPTRQESVSRVNIYVYITNALYCVYFYISFRFHKKSNF